MNTSLHCPGCKTAFAPSYFNAGYFISCPVCGAGLRAEVFPAFYRPPVIRRAESMIEAEQSSCFYHADKSAEAVCDGCGRFLCALCDIVMSDKHYCPSCLESGKRKGKMSALRREHTRYDKIAGTLAVLSMVLFFAGIGLALAPASIILSLYHWRTPCSLVQGSRGNFIAAILLSLLVLGLYGLVFVGLFSGGF